jgi:peptidoglycan/LPS O-acetylase OafA/YrhL
VLTDRLDAVAGGWTWQSATFAVLEGPAAVGFSLWALAWFRRRWDRLGSLTRWAGQGSYAAYVLHPPVLVLASMAARPLPLVPEVKFVLVAAAGVVASFALGAAVARMAPPARRGGPRACSVVSGVR